MLSSATEDYIASSAGRTGSFDCGRAAMDIRKNCLYDSLSCYVARPGARSVWEMEVTEMNWFFGPVAYNRSPLVEAQV